MRSKDFRRYIIVTKKPNYSVHQFEGDKELKDVEELTVEERDKTFWLFDKESEEFVGRYSVESAPQWIMEIYEIIVQDETS